MCNVCCTVIIGAKSLYNHGEVCWDLQVTPTLHRYHYAKYLKGCGVHRKFKILFGSVCPGCDSNVDVRILDVGRNWKRSLD